MTEFVATTPKRAWAVLGNFNNQAEWAPEISQAKVISRNGNTLELQQTYRTGYTFGLPIKPRLRVQETPPKGFSYVLISGNRLNSLRGQWTITPMAQGVQLKHQMQVDPQVPGPLHPFYYEQQENNLRGWISVLKRKVEAQ